MTDSLLTIQKISARAVLAPLVRPIKTAVGDVPEAPLILIDVSTHQGVSGRSYIFCYTPITVRPLVDLIEEMAKTLENKTVAPFERMEDFEKMFRLLGKQGLVGMAISGLDMAFWDVLGRYHDQPVSNLLGGSCRPIDAYDSFGLIDPQTDAAELEKSLERGFKAIKIKIGSGGVDDDEHIVSAVRSIIGKEIELMVDYNQSLTAPEAIRRIDRLSKFDLLWVEEPVPAENLAGHACVRTASSIAIQTGENWWFPDDAAQAIQANASDYAMLDIMKIGGVTGWVRAAAIAAGASIPVSSHIFVEASAHVMASTPLAHWLEYLDVASAVLENPTVIKAGQVRPTGPGLGMDWDEGAVSRYGL